MRSDIAAVTVGVLSFIGCAAQPPPAPASSPPPQTSAAGAESAAARSDPPASEGAPPAAAASGSNADALGKHLTVPKLRLGHYSSGDGRVGFVFDRLGPKPKLRMDGTTSIVELTPREAPLDQTDLLTSNGKVMIRLGSSGQVTYFRGNDSFPMARDADADPLTPGAAGSTAGPAPAPGDAIGKHLGTPLLRLGHYSSGDGLTGFVFDRTDTKPKIRMDGASEILELTPRDAPLGQTDLAHGSQGVIIRLGEGGQVTYFRGPRGDSVRMIRDADAEPLKK